MVTRCVMPACCSVSMTARMASSDLVGFSRAVPSTEPPVRWTRDTASMVSGAMREASRRTRCLNPSRMPADLEALVEGLDGGGGDDCVDAWSRAAADQNPQASPRRHAYSLRAIFPHRLTASSAAVDVAGFLRGAGGVSNAARPPELVPGCPALVLTGSEAYACRYYSPRQPAAFVGWTPSRPRRKEAPSWV